MAAVIAERRSNGGGIAIVAVVLLALLAERTMGQSTPDEERQTQIRAWIEALASPNPPPQHSGRDISIPVGYDRVAQQKVYDAWGSLENAGIEAFPLLIAQHDERYCCSVHGANGDLNLSVGAVCGGIVIAQVEAYQRVIAHSFPGAWPKYFSHEDHRDLSEWWQARNHQTLRELQLEVARWALERLKHPTARDQRRPEQQSAKKTQEDIRALEEFIARLEAANQPAPGKSTYRNEMKGLPDGYVRKAKKPS